jgi:hypothetical protein
MIIPQILLFGAFLTQDDSGHDGRSLQITHDAALVARIATWLRGKKAGPAVPDHLATAIPLFHAMPSTVPAANPMAGGWAEEPGPDERFGAWRNSMA